MATVGDRIEKAFEDLYPHLIGAGVGLLSLTLSDDIASSIKAYSLKIDQAYSGVFGLVTVLTGFLFTFFTFIVTTDHGFIGKARSSIYLRRANAFTITALISGATAALCSLAMMVWQPNLSWLPGLIAFAVWVGVSVWSVLAFERAARLFIVFARRHAG